MDDVNPGEPTLVDVMDGRSIPFSEGGALFHIRQPTTEEYDDALCLQNMVIRRMLALPEVAELKATPCSEQERLTFAAMIRQAEAAFAAAEDGSAKKQAMLEEVARLGRQLERRTLADEIAAERGILARDRWLTQRLLCDAAEQPFFEPKAVDFQAKWEALPLAVKDAARAAVWQALALVRNAPFLSEPRPRPKSG